MTCLPHALALQLAEIPRPTVGKIIADVGRKSLSFSLPPSLSLSLSLSLFLSVLLRIS